jgi:hypothetical protein
MTASGQLHKPSKTALVKTMILKFKSYLQSFRLLTPILSVKMSSNSEQHAKMLKKHSEANIDEYIHTCTFNEELAEVSVAQLHSHFAFLTGLTSRLSVNTSTLNWRARFSSVS